MSKNRLRLPSASMLISLLALFVALGGTGYAVSKIDGSKLKSRSVAGSKLKRNTVTGKEIKESRLARVPDAGRLGGAPATAFLQNCFMGTVHGFVRVKATADFPAAYTDAVGAQFDFPFSCQEGKIYARRVEEGVYRVHFDPPVGAIALANAEGGGYASTVGLEDSSAPGADKFTFEVRVRSADNIARPTDAAFSIVVP